MRLPDEVVAKAPGRAQVVETLTHDSVQTIERFVEAQMAKYNNIDTRPRLIAMDLSRQSLAGTFGHALNYLLDHDVDLSHFDARFQKDETGAPTYPPAVLLKVVLFAYS